MLSVGITGGIGSGKSTVAKIFSVLGVPVFNADEAARWLMEHDSNLVNAIKNLFGNDVYTNGVLQRKLLAEIVFNNNQKLAELNAATHPATIKYFLKWKEQQQAPYILKEAAILFESGANRGLNKVINVTAPESLRISRVKERDGLSETQIKQRMDKQLTDTERNARSDFEIINDEQFELIPQVIQIHEALLKLS